MNFDTERKTIKSLFSSKKQFEIPRFQREYSWEKQHLSEFWEDIIMHVKLEEGVLVTSEYFWGTMLVIGSFTDTNKMLIVDGQQRLTTMTIFFSCLSNLYLEQKKKELSDISWSYLSFKDDDNNEKYILLNESPNPFFQRKIQTLGTSGVDASSEEEKKIETAFDYLKDCLSEAKMRRMFKQNNISVENISYIDLLKSVRDQILNSIVICISTLRKNEASMIFEILNAKGKSLSNIDLIKNKIFEVMKTEVPTDEAKNYWRDTQKILVKDGEYVDFLTFFHYYWISNYNSTSVNALYEKFKKQIKQTESEYIAFLKNLKQSAGTYMKIIKPSREQYKNRQEYFYLVESLKNLNNNFNIKISRVILLALLESHAKDLVSSKTLKKAIRFIEKYHFVRNTLLKQRGNLQSKYSEFANKLRKCKNKNESEAIVNALINDLKNLLPKCEQFEGAFINLKFTKADVLTNIPSKYVVQSLNKFYENIDYVTDNLSLEHIINECNNENSCNIGNILMIEKNINESMSGINYNEKLKYFEESKLTIVKDFLGKYTLSDWDEKTIKKRAIEMAKVFYYKIIKEEDEIPNI